MWRKLLHENDEALIINLTTFIYGISSLLAGTTIVLLSSPERHFMVVLLLALPLINTMAAVKNWCNIKGWSSVLIAVMWAFIAFLYFFNTIVNSGWILSLSMMGFSFLSLYKGEYRE